MLHGTIDPPDVVPDDKPLLEEAAALAAELDWSADPWPALTGHLQDATGRKGRSLVHPLRLALTGRESGPEMAPLLTLIGRDRAIARLRAAAS
jgi:glutamyl-tRNA synthetase